MSPAFWLWVAPALASAGAETQPASRPAGKVVAYQPGIRIDWGRREVLIDSTVVLREGLLELFACSPGTKEHESILRVNCRPLHIYQGLGLIGLTPGTPPAWDEKADRPIPPTGDRVDVLVRYPAANNQTKEIHACDWMMEGDKVLSPRSWVFAGSFRTDDGRLSADGEGTVVTVVDFADALLALAESHSSDNSQLWLAARTAEIPPIGTNCTLILRSADEDRCQITLDRFGRMTFAGQALSRDQLREKLLQKLRFQKDLTVELRADAAVSQSLLERTVAWLNEIGLPPGQIRIRRNDSAGFPQHDPDAGLAFLQSQVGDLRILLDQLARNHEQLAGQMRLAGTRLDEIARQMQGYLQQGRQRFREMVHQVNKGAGKP